MPTVNARHFDVDRDMSFQAKTAAYGRSVWLYRRRWGRKSVMGNCSPVTSLGRG